MYAVLLDQPRLSGRLWHHIFHNTIVLFRFVFFFSLLFFSISYFYGRACFDVFSSPVG